MYLGTDVSGHNHVWWAQIKCVWAQMCMGTIVSGHNRVWAKSCLGKVVSGQSHVWAQTWWNRVARATQLERGSIYIPPSYLTLIWLGYVKGLLHEVNNHA